MSTAALVDCDGTQYEETAVQGDSSTLHTAVDPTPSVAVFTSEDIKRLVDAIARIMWSPSALDTAVEPGAPPAAVAKDSGGGQRPVATTISIGDLRNYKPAFDDMPDWLVHPPRSDGIVPLAAARRTSFYMEPTLNTMAYTAAMRHGGHVEHDYAMLPTGHVAQPMHSDTVNKELAELHKVHSDYPLGTVDATQSQYAMDGVDAQYNTDNADREQRQHCTNLEIIQCVLERTRDYNAEQAALAAGHCAAADTDAGAFALVHDSCTDTAVEPLGTGDYAAVAAAPRLVFVPAAVRVLQPPADASAYIMDRAQ